MSSSGFWNWSLIGPKYAQSFEQSSSYLTTALSGILRSVTNHIFFPWSALDTRTRGGGVKNERGEVTAPRPPSHWLGTKSEPKRQSTAGHKPFFGFRFSRHKTTVMTPGVLAGTIPHLDVVRWLACPRDARYAGWLSQALYTSTAGSSVSQNQRESGMKFSSIEFRPVGNEQYWSHPPALDFTVNPIDHCSRKNEYATWAGIGTKGVRKAPWHNSQCAEYTLIVRTFFNRSYSTYINPVATVHSSRLYSVLSPTSC